MRNERVEVADIEHENCLSVICKLQGLLGSALQARQTLYTLAGKSHTQTQSCTEIQT